MKNTPQPNKDLGQHWLDDEASLQAVADAASATEEDLVVEIGPGLGTLTSVLVERANQVIAIEFDERLAAGLPQRVPAVNLEVITADIRKFDFSALPNNYKVVGNVPYYLTSNIIRILLELDNKPAAIGLLIQKEVAERLAAEAGQYSVLGVIAQFYANVELGPVVPRSFFDPEPKVDSQVVSLIPKSELPDIDRKKFFQLIKAGFGERRKTLANSLSGGLRKQKNEIQSSLEKAGINPLARAQELSLEQWESLYRTLYT